MNEKATAIPDFLNELRPRVTGDLRTDKYSKLLYSTDASIYQMMPYGVLLPQTNDDVFAATELAAKYRLPILPRAGGSSLAGQCVNDALVIDTSKHLTKVLELNVEERWVRVEPGIVLDQLNLYLEPHGLKFGPDPASSSRAGMGGIVSNNSTGSHSILYGMTADHVLECKVVLSDGSVTTLGPRSTHELMQFQTKSSLEAEIYRQICALTYSDKNRDIIAAGTPRHWRRCGGYNLDRFVGGDGVSFRYPYDRTFNLAKLICGAEGTLAVISEIKLNLVPLPKASALAIVHFASLKEALDAVPLMLDVDPSAIELIDNLGLRMCKDVPEYARLLKTFVEGDPNCLLLTEFYGENDRELRSKMANLERCFKRNGVNTLATTTAYDEQKQADVWKVRKVGLGLLMSVKGDHKPIPFIEDAAVPPEYLSEYIQRIEQFCNDLGTDVAYYAHASAGCLHVRPLINTKIAKDIEKLPEITAFSAELLGEYSGALSSEHGDGRARSWLNKRFFGAELYDLYCQVKTTFDPLNIMNPGNVVEAEPMTENLRYGTGYGVIPLTEKIDFTADQGFHRAVEMCNGAGVCRKTTADSMCPSFMATMEEEHSTRGRANMLRSVLSGKLDAGELTGDRLYETMDLCISCKACKAECPSSVDMAKIKLEWMAHYNEANGTPLRARVFANIARLSQLGSAFAPIANKTLSNGPIRKLMAHRLGIAPERTLPVFAKDSYLKWYKQHRKNGFVRSNKKVVLLNDTYNTFNYPEISIAAHEVLEHLGYEVVLPGHTDVGRPALSKGLLDEARQFATETLDKLAPFAQSNTPIISLEPSDASAIRDDYASIVPSDPRLQTVIAQTVTFEEFIAKAIKNGELEGKFERQSGPALLHGHCHQKALIGTKPSHAVLAFLGYAVVEVDSGCCGMAGSFGYEAEHYDISLTMAERRLLPAVRKQDSKTPIVAAGVSCRQQIKHGAGRRAVHSAELLHKAIHQ